MYYANAKGTVKKVREIKLQGCVNIQGAESLNSCLINTARNFFNSENYQLAHGRKHDGRHKTWHCAVMRGPIFSSCCLLPAKMTNEQRICSNAEFGTARQVMISQLVGSNQKQTPTTLKGWLSFQATQLIRVPHSTTEQFSPSSVALRSQLGQLPRCRR